ncbi:MAG: hypothetical protein F7B18_06700 [Desulfurococcales archaeon]|nr:hypothetical protein [Desulfurococcales archaeon]
MYTPTAQLLAIEEAGNKLYNAKIRITYQGKTLEVTVRNISRRPHNLKARIEGEYILVDIQDPSGEGVATCCIHRAHLERGTGGECRSLLLPPR